MCRGGDRVSRERPGEGAPRSRRERPEARYPAWMSGGRGRPPRPPPARPAQSLDSAPGLRRLPRLAEPPPARPASPPRGPRGRDPRPGTPVDTARRIQLRPRWEARPGERPLASGPRARATGGGAGRRDPAGGGPRARTPTSEPGFARRMQAPSPARPRVSPGPRPGPRGGGVGLRGGASGARRARKRAAAAASGPRAAATATATALSRRRPRRPPPRARPLAPPRPEPPPGPRRRRRPPLRFVFPSLSVTCLCLPPAPTLRSGHSHHPRGPGARRPRETGSPVGPLGTEAETGAGGYRTPQGADEFRETPRIPGQMALPATPLRREKITGVLLGLSLPQFPSVGPRARPALRGPCGLTDPAGAAPSGIPRPLRPRSPPAARGRPRPAAGGRRQRRPARGHATRGCEARRPRVLSPWAAGSPRAGLQEGSGGTTTPRRLLLRPHRQGPREAPKPAVLKRFCGWSLWP
ncbi:uncharacterized protein [Callorhinus ursinus]|uniref:uncharacterized protein n=1 Tax=Callorhinus ursinus TaxID=34884 RepID=UPI003CD01A69